MKIICLICMVLAFYLGITGIGESDKCIMLMIFIISMYIFDKEE